MPQQKMSDAEINARARAALKLLAVKRTQEIFAQNFPTPVSGQVVNVIPRNVGLILGFWVKVVHTVVNGTAVNLVPTDFGPANSLAQVQYNDLQNVTRHQICGAGLSFVNSEKLRNPFGSSLVNGTGIASPVDYGNNFAGQISAAQIDDGDTGTVTMWYWVPLAYSHEDFRGVVYAGVVNATQQLNLTLPGANGVTLAVANGTDSTLAMFEGDAPGAVALATISNTYVQVYQVYLDQIPVIPGVGPNGQPGLALPIMDMSIMYELKQTTQTGIQAAQDFGFQYPNFRDFLSTTVVYVNTGATGARGDGSDINYWSLQSANATNIWKKNPDLISLETRNYLKLDMPKGVYYFGTREKPISTTQYGNMQLMLNAVTAGAGAYQLVFVEDFAVMKTLSIAGSLPSA